MNTEELYAKLNRINGIGLYGELLEPRIPQYRAARTIIETLEKLTYQKLGDTKELSVKAEAVESRFSSEDDIPKGWKIMVSLLSYEE